MPLSTDAPPLPSRSSPVGAARELDPASIAAFPSFYTSSASLCAQDLNLQEPGTSTSPNIHEGIQVPSTTFTVSVLLQKASELDLISKSATSGSLLPMHLEKLSNFYLTS
ncbi:hypothetical protein ABZP36_031235 [Zizania latifolia]